MEPLEIMIYPSQTDGKRKYPSLGKDRCRIIRRDFHHKMCVCVYVELIQRQNSGVYLAVVIQRAHHSPLRLREAQVRLSWPCVL